MVLSSIEEIVAWLLKCFRKQPIGNYPLSAEEPLVSFASGFEPPFIESQDTIVPLGEAFATDFSKDVGERYKFFCQFLIEEVEVLMVKLFKEGGEGAIGTFAKRDIVVNVIELTVKTVREKPAYKK